MNIVVSGSHGLVGSALLPTLMAKGHRVRLLVRSTPESAAQIVWDPLKTGPLPESLEGTEAVIHLAGDSIASGRWTESKKRAIRESRVMGTRLLSEALTRMPNPPATLICASAIGYYGDRGADLMTEDSAPGTGFLPDVCKAWEAAAAPAVQKGIRVVHLRFGIVLSPRGGALAKMLLPFKMGVGGILGTSRQYMSWIALDDVVSVIEYALGTSSLRGAVNTVVPQAVTNAEYTRTLGRVLSRPTIFPMPAFAARLAFGEMADALLLASTRVQPAILERSGFRFQWGDLESALRHLLHS